MEETGILEKATLSGPCYPALNQVNDRPFRLFSAQQGAFQRFSGWGWHFLLTVAEFGRCLEVGLD